MTDNIEVPAEKKAGGRTRRKAEAGAQTGARRRSATRPRAQGRTKTTEKAAAEKPSRVAKSAAKTAAKAQSARTGRAKNKLKIIPLGGVGEIGKNMTVLEYGKDMIIIDCGLIFPDDDMPGIDLVIPDMTYVEKNADKLRGILVTHGHEDHIGALPFALKQFQTPVYGTKLTCALIEHKLEEERVKNAKLNVIKPGDKVQLGCFTAEFIKTSHSIPGAVALAIVTPVGTIIHTGDFKVDYTPLDGEPMDMGRFAYYGSKGVLALMSDSTNAELSGHTISEREIGKTFEHYFDIADGRVIVATFASNIYRIQQIADVAISFGRVICFQGRSMVNITKVAAELGYLNIPEEKIVEVEKLKRIDDSKVCVITTSEELECDVEEGIRILADREQMRRVLINLLKNAEQSIPEGRQGVIRITVRKKEGKVEIRIRDNGQGIPENLREKIFQPNFTTKSSGMGLGLAICKRIIESMGGEIGFVSEVGVGTEFFIILDIVRA